MDFYTFGNHFRQLCPSLSTQHFKFVHEVLPLGIQRFCEAVRKDDARKRCPCCKAADESHHHFLRCTANPVFKSSLAAFDPMFFQLILTLSGCTLSQMASATCSHLISRFPHTSTSTRHRRTLMIQTNRSQNKIKREDERKTFPYNTGQSTSSGRK